MLKHSRRVHAALLLVPLLRIGLLSGHDEAAVAAAREPFARDPLLDVSLLELLMHPVDAARSPLDVQLQVASARCRELGVHALFVDKQEKPSTTDSDGPSHQEEEDDEYQRESERREHAQYCRRLRYVRHVRDKHRLLRKEVSELQQQEASEQIQLVREVSTRSVSDVDLQEFFEQYAEKAQPALLTPTATTPAEGAAEGASSNDNQVLGFATEQELIQFQEKCFDPHKKIAPMRLQDPECAKSLEHFRVPIHLAHNYIRRTNVSLSETFLPALVHLPSGVSEKDILSCPYGLHMLAMTLSDGSVDVDIFDRRFKPFQSYANSDLEEIEISAASGGFFGSTNARAERKTIASSAFLAHLSPLHHTETSLPAHSFLFVPGSKFAKIRATTTSGGDSPGGQKLLRFCFVDASNFNAVKQDVGVEALVNDEAHTLALSLQSPAFDRSMSRRVQPTDLVWQNYITWPKETKFVKKSDLMNSEGGNEQLLLSRRERLKQWQDDRRWERHIETLTLPVSLPPVVVNITRTTATLRWQDLYETAKHDITPYGYILRWKEEIGGEDKEVRTTSAGASDDEGSEAHAANTMKLTRRQLVRSALPTTLFGDDFDGKDIEGVVSGLQAETRYTFSVQIYVDDTVGLNSYSSRTAQTSPCSEPSGVRGVPTASDVEGTCATLRWLDPSDSGGKPIGLYLIGMREVNSEVDALAVGAHDSTQTTEGEKVVTLDGRFASSLVAGQDGWKSAQLCKLVPGATYLFRMAAMNAIGVGPWSARSDPVHVPSRDTLASSRRLTVLSAEKVVPTLKGKGDPDYVPMHTFSLRELHDLVTSHGPEVVVSTLSASSMDGADQAARSLKVILSDVHETIVLKTSADEDAQLPESSSDTPSDNEISFDVWAAHYSPRSFHVSSEIVRADPLDASTPLRNGDQVKDRVVLVTRGAVPFVFKAHYAQLAGAIGIIIADVNDTCHGRFDQLCVPGGDRSRGEGFAAQDRHALWEQNHTPCVLALQDASQRLLELVAP